MMLELERLRHKRETNLSYREGEKANQAGNERVIFGGAISPDLPHFMDRKGDLDSYLLQCYICKVVSS